MTPIQIADRLQSYSVRLRTGSLYRANALWTIWQSFNDAQNPLRAPDIKRRSAAGAINILASSALHETIMIIARALDGPGRGNATATNRVSFPIMVELMEMEGVQEELVRRARNWFEDGFRAEENAASARQAMSEFRELSGSLRSSDGATRLRAFRDEFLAHNLEFEEERRRPIIKNVTDLLSELTALSDKASLAFEGSDTVWEMGADALRHSCAELWRLIETGARVS